MVDWFPMCPSQCQPTKGYLKFGACLKQSRQLFGGAGIKLLAFLGVRGKKPCDEGMAAFGGPNRESELMGNNLRSFPLASPKPPTHKLAATNVWCLKTSKLKKRTGEIDSHVLTYGARNDLGWLAVVLEIGPGAWFPLKPTKRGVHRLKKKANRLEPTRERLPANTEPQTSDSATRTRNSPRQQAICAHGQRLGRPNQDAPSGGAEGSGARQVELAVLGVLQKDNVKKR